MDDAVSFPPTHTDKQPRYQAFPHKICRVCWYYSHSIPLLNFNRLAPSHWFSPELKYTRHSVDILYWICALLSWYFPRALKLGGYTVILNIFLQQCFLSTQSTLLASVVLCHFPRKHCAVENPLFVCQEKLYASLHNGCPLFVQWKRKTIVEFSTYLLYLLTSPLVAHISLIACVSSSFLPSVLSG